MKANRSDLTAFGPWLTVSFLIATIFVAGFFLGILLRDRPVVEAGSGPPAKAYVLAESAPGWFLITANVRNPSYDWLGESLNDGLKELATRYEIVEIVPLQEKWDNGSRTRGLLVKIKTK